MQKSIVSLFTIGIALAVGITPTRAQNKDEKEHLNNLVHEINDAAKKGEMMNVALHTTSVETGVPREQIDALHKRFQDVGPAGILLSCVFAAETKKDPEYFIKRHTSKGWPAIAEENKVPLDKLTVRLERLERALQPDKSRKQKNR